MLFGVASMTLTGTTVAVVTEDPRHAEFAPDQSCRHCSALAFLPVVGPMGGPPNFERPNLTS